MNTSSPSTVVNMSAYVALSCLIAFVIVITICLIKQFIWDPLLAKPFEVIRPVLTESVRKFSTPFYRPQSNSTSTLSMQKSLSDSCVHSTTMNSHEAILATTATTISSPQAPTATSTQQQLNEYQINLLNKKLSPRRSYGSSALNSYAYTNFGSEDVVDEISHPCPILHFSCEYNPSTFSIRLNIQNLRHMNCLETYFHPLIDRSAWIFVRFMFTNPIIGEPYETSLQHFQDFIRFGDTFNILSNIRAGDSLNHQITFYLHLLTEENLYQLGQTTYSMKDEQLTHILFLERILPIRIENAASN